MEEGGGVPRAKEICRIIPLFPRVLKIGQIWYTHHIGMFSSGFEPESQQSHIIPHPQTVRLIRIVNSVECDFTSVPPPVFRPK